MTIDIEELRKRLFYRVDITLEVQTVEELLNRLEAAEKGRDDVSQQLVQSEIGKREISEAHNAVTRRLSVLADENTALRTKVEQMEKQEPIAWTTEFALELGSSALGFDACRGNLWGEKGVPLYALPGAKGEEK